MKKTGKCPKCGSADVVNPSDRRIQGKLGYLIVDLLYLVCTDCGFYEEYVEDQKQLGKLKSKIVR